MTHGSPEQWQRIKELFDRALALDPVQRRMFLDREGRDDDERHEVETLLASHDHDPDFLGDTPAVQAAELLATAADPRIGRFLGPYRILAEIAHGGMGKVYLGERSEPYRQRVAIKVIKRGMDTEEVVRRFAYERQVLAALDHPNIARILDGGATDDGVPYLVLDYIEGVSIDEYCATHALPIEQRLDLFLKICNAVAYAHRNLVVHRDLKPTNIVVSADGTPVLLDFGIAKVLDPHLVGGTVAKTAAGPGPMTPEYASPEQLLGRAVTTSSDVYSLAVILFELLAGTRFAQVAALTPKTIQLLATEEAPRPSVAALRAPNKSDAERKILSRALRGDLDTIVLHALEKDPARRYASVEQFAEDVRRYQRGLPVAARQGLWTYRAGKFVRRHRIGVGAALVLFVVISGASAVTLMEKRNAERQRVIATNAANEMVFQVADAMARMSGPTEARLGLLIHAQTIFDEIKTDRTSRDIVKRTAEANRTLAQTYLLLGDAKRAYDRIGVAERSLRSYAVAGDATADELSTYGSIESERGDIVAAMKDGPRAAAAYDRAVSFLARARRLDAKPVVRSAYALVLTRKADRSYSEGKYADAEGLFRQAHAEMQVVTNAMPKDPIHWSRYAMALERVADCLYYSGRSDDACEQYATATRIREQSIRLHPDATDLRSGLAIAHQNCAYCAEEQGRVDEAIGLYLKGIELQRGLVREDPLNATKIGNLMGGLAQLASTHHRRGDFAAAVALLEESSRISRAFGERQDATPAIITSAANNAQVLGDTLTKMGRHAEAENALQSALRDFEELRRRDPANIDHVRNVASAELSIVRLLQRRGDRIAALRHARRAVDAQRVAARSGLPADLEELGHALYELGAELYAHRDDAGAAAAVREGRNVLLALREKNQLSPSSDGAQRYLPALEKLARELQ